MPTLNEAAVCWRQNRTGRSAFGAEARVIIVPATVATAVAGATCGARTASAAEWVCCRSGVVKSTHGTLEVTQLDNWSHVL